MKKLFALMVLGLSLIQAEAQTISQTFNDVSLSEVLRTLNDATSRYDVNFIYNELEDFRVSTSIQNQTVPDAVRQVVGFYPMRVSIADSLITVECTHKTDSHLRGRLVDETGEPVVYATVALYTPQDSTFLNGGVSNDSGIFVIPVEMMPVLAKISLIGYKEHWMLCETEYAGTIRMEPESFELQGTTVTAERPQLVQSKNGSLVANVQGTPLKQFGSVTEMLTHLPLMMSNGEIAGHGKPEIYINNKKVRDEEELDRLRADEILSAEIITNPGPEYGANVTSVIKLRTVRKAGEGWSGNFSAAYRQGQEHYESANVSLNYRTRNGMDFFARGYFTDNNSLITATSNDQLQASSLWDYEKSAEWLSRVKYYFADLGWNWEINDHHSIGLTYTANNYIGDFKTQRTFDEQVWQDGTLVDGGHSVTTTLGKPRMTHTVNAYYVGEVGKWKLDFSTDFYNAHSVSDMSGGTEGSTTVSSQTNTENQLIAEKLVITAPVPKGNLTFGEEASAVDRTSDFTQSGFSADNSVHQQTAMWSLFANYALHLGKFSFNAGLRWQNEHNRYDYNGQQDDEMSPDYHVFIPRASVTYNSGDWTHKLSFFTARQNPSYNLLSSAINYRSKYEYDTGNPLLQPQTTQQLSWSSNWKWFYVEAYYQYTQNLIRSFQTAYDDINHPGVMIMDYRNSPKCQEYGIELNFSPKIGIWQMNYTVGLGFADEDVEALGITHKWNGLISSFTLDNTFTLPHSWLLNIKGNLSPYNETRCAQTKTTGSLNIRLSKQFLKDKSLTVAILANDLLHTQYTEMTAYSGINMRTQFRQYNDSRRIGIDLSWRFNATRSRYKGSHAGQSERNRL